MKKIVLTYGLISGALITGFMLISMINSDCDTDLNNVNSMIIGFAAMIAAFSLLFFGLAKYRRTVGEGVLTFKTAISMSLLMVLIVSTMYTIGWIIEYKLFMPDFADKYELARIKQLANLNLPTAEYEKQVSSIKEEMAFYRTPLGLIMFTYVEILSMGIPMALIAALVMMRRKKKAEQ